ALLAASTTVMAAGHRSQTAHALQSAPRPTNGGMRDMGAKNKEAAGKRRENGQATAGSAEGAGRQGAKGAKAKGKPNILVIMGDDIGIPQLSAYTKGLMGYRTPNIDRIFD